jgi:hypothetical protein
MKTVLIILSITLLILVITVYVLVDVLKDMELENRYLINKLNQNK